ncbi:MAG: DoxX family protein [Stagnimonas sp.]|nr:DoxX family protein [Stagnimonas sp.]
MSLGTLLGKSQQALDATRVVDWLAPLLLRLYLAPIFWMAGWNKLMAFQSTVEWFGDKDWGLGLPLPFLMASLATGAELVGAICLLLGLGVRWASVPLMATMVVAMTTVHWHNGWLAIAEGMGPFATERTSAAVERLAKAKEILMQHGNYEWLTEYGSLAILNNGIEFAVTYFVMLLVLFFGGAGRYVSLDYWISRRLGASTTRVIP